MASNSLGKFFRVTSFGESHGTYVGCVIDSIPSNIPINLKKVQEQVERRKPAANFATARTEEDKVEIISGLHNGKTTGAPICILIANKNTRSADYKDLKNKYRPNHADYTYESKYKNRDANGGGRSSMRITVAMVAAGQIAEQIIQHWHKKIEIIAYVSQIGKIGLQSKIIEKKLSRKKIDQYLTRIPLAAINKQAIDLLNKTKLNGDTLGGIISVIINEVPIGIGEPIFSKLQAELAHAMLSINSVKGFEYGDGFASTMALGSEHNDPFTSSISNDIQTSSNHSGGIQGGISNGMPICFNVAFKPISSIQHTQRTVNKLGQSTNIQIQGRHDVCAVPRAIPIVEAYTAIVILDLFLQNNMYRK